MAITLLEIRGDVRARVSDEENKLTNTFLTHVSNIGQNVVYNQLLPIISVKLTATHKQNTAIGQAEYPLPADCRDVRRVKLNNKKAREKGIDEIDSVDSGFELATIDEPAFLEWAGKIEIHPIPTSIIVDGIRTDYLKQTVPLVLDGDKSIIPEEYHGLIVDYVESLALRKLDRVDKATVADGTISKMFTDILNANTRAIQMQEIDKQRK